MKKTTLSTLLIILLLLITLTSYNTKVNTNSLLGVWMLEYEINNRYINDTSNFHKNEKPVILDFQKNNILTIKRYGIKDTTIRTKWFFKSDSILTIDSVDSKIGKLKKNRLSLISYNTEDTLSYNFKRPKKVNIKQNKKQIKNILLSNIWENKNLFSDGTITNYEFFKNKSMIVRYKRHPNDSLHHLQLENWGLAEYKNYYFLYNYSNMYLGRGNWEQINQILEITSNSFSISCSENKLYGDTFSSIKKNNENFNEKILGNWKSKNSKDKFYGKYISTKQIENGNTILYNDELEFNITKEKLYCKIDSLKITYDWVIGKDGKTLILEYKDLLEMGTFIKFADILELSKNKLKIQLFNSNFYTGAKNKPYEYIINRIQEFTRTE